MLATTMSSLGKWRPFPAQRVGNHGFQTSLAACPCDPASPIGQNLHVDFPSDVKDSKVVSTLGPLPQSASLNSVINSRHCSPIRQAGLKHLKVLVWAVGSGWQWHRRNILEAHPHRVSGRKPFGGSLASCRGSNQGVRVSGPACYTSRASGW